MAGGCWFLLAVGFTLTTTTQASGYSSWFRNGRLRDGFVPRDTEESRESAANGQDVISLNEIAQKLDHFNTTDDRIWNQRFFMNTAYYKVGGPIFLMIYGEATMSYRDITKEHGGNWVVQAAHFGALCLMLEHRYYGGSRPTADASTPNLKWLSSEQALADIAYFVQFINKVYKLKDPKWIVFGGSYAATGAVASSAPVEAKTNFWEYLQVVRNSLASYNEHCVNTIGNATKMIEDRIKTGTDMQGLRRKLRVCRSCDFSNQKDLSTFWADSFFQFAGVVQYSQDNAGIYADILTIPKVCSILNNLSLGDELERYASAMSYILDKTWSRCLSSSYQESVSMYQYYSTVGDISGRLWFYQTCTEFGYYQTSDLQTDNPFPHSFSLSYFTDFCRDVFGETFGDQLVRTAVKETNIRNGAKNLKKPNILLLNGSIDPWHALGVLNDTTPETVAVFIEGVAHCAEMNKARNPEWPQLRAARAKITESIAEWLGQKTFANAEAA